jgi:hypothetical protein
MSINISTKIRNKIIDDNHRSNIEDLLVQKAAGKCFLCGGRLDSSTQSIEADHDIPESSGGATDLHNLNLAHSECNKFKRQNPTVQVKVFLPLRRFIAQNPESNFERVSKELFNITQETISINRDPNNTISFRYGTVKIDEIKIYTENIPGRKIVEYCFVQLPVKVIYNDDVQPRPIKPNHVFSLFQDLHLNPLHEPASARLEHSNLNGVNKLLMFDGQHKSVAKIMIDSVNKISSGDVKIDLKIYLNLDKKEATHLVNSIQSKIIKLGLTKSEFAKKMGNEWEFIFKVYEENCEQSGEIPSEKGFVNAAPAEERRRRKEALIQARLKQLIEPRDENDLELKIFTLTKTVDKSLEIKEATLFSKLLQKFLTITPLSLEIDNDDTARSIERENIRSVLDIIYEELFVETPNLTKTTIAQLKSQSSLGLIVDYTKLFFANVLFVDKPEIFFNNNLASKLHAFRNFVIKYREHPIWKHADNQTFSRKVEKFYNLLKQNQSLLEIAREIRLTQGYCAGFDQLEGRELI